MLLYSCLYLSGYDLTLDDIKQFRQWESRTPGHPEHGQTAGVETTTGPLIQGIGNAVGLAVAEAHLATTFNKPGHEIVDHYTYFICSDGDLMEGISHEAASFAGHYKLGKLIGFYDDNHITIDGSTDLTFTDDTAKRFEAYGWQVLHIGDVNDLDQIEAAIGQAQSDPDRPTLIVTRTHIGFGSPRQHSEKAHGEALGVENVLITKKNIGWPSIEPFFMPPEALAEWRKTKGKVRDSWNPECGQVSIPAAWSSSKSAKRTNSRSTARRKASVNRAVSCAGHDTNVPSGRKPPPVTRRCRCGCQLASEPCVCRQATIPTTRSRSPVSVRIAAVTVRAAMRAISPSRRRRYRQYARSRFGMVRTTCRCGTGASSVVSSHWAQIARRFAWQLGQKYRHLQENASRYSWAQASHRMRANPCSRMPQARNLSVTSPTTGRHGPYSRAKRSSYTVCRRWR